MNAVLKHCALVAVCATGLVFSSARVEAQTSFGRMRDAGRPAPEIPDADNEDAAPSDAKENATTPGKKPAAKPSSAKPASSSASAASASSRANASRQTNPARNAANSKTTSTPKRSTATNAASSRKPEAPAATETTDKSEKNEKPAARASSSKRDLDSAPKGNHGPILGSPTSHKYRAGMIFGAQPGGSCSNVLGTAPVPMEFPEQKVRTLEEDFPRVAKVSYRDLKEGGARQLVFKMNELKEGQTVEATALFEVTRYTILPPNEIDVYLIPKTVPTDVKRYLKESKYMESTSKTVKSLAKETTKDIEGAWQKVDAILAFVRDNIQYKEVLIEKPMRGALAALRSRDGDCEDMSALFISMCRAIDVPARLVRVPGHCWAEFYLVDDEKVGYWFPAQVAGTDPLGGLQDTRVILQKGDSFKLPESPREEELYVKELFTGKVREGGPDPIHQFVQEVDGK